MRLLFRRFAFLHVIQCIVGVQTIISPFHPVSLVHAEDLSQLPRVSILEAFQNETGGDGEYLRSLTPTIILDETPNPSQQSDLTPAPAIVPDSPSFYPDSGDLSSSPTQFEQNSPDTIMPTGTPGDEENPTPTPISSATRAFELFWIKGCWNEIETDATASLVIFAGMHLLFLLWLSQISTGFYAICLHLTRNQVSWNFCRRYVRTAQLYSLIMNFGRHDLFSAVLAQASLSQAESNVWGVTIDYRRTWSLLTRNGSQSKRILVSTHLKQWSIT